MNKLVQVLLLPLAFASGAWCQPTVDRVGFPTGYRDTFKKLMTVDRADNGQIRVIWGNSIAASVPWWEQYPYGSVLIFESYTAVRDAAGALVFDGDGRLIPNVLGTIFVQRKEKGFGEAYADARNGEWEYMSYRADGSAAQTPQSTQACAVCHYQAGAKDYVFRRDKFGRSSGAVPGGTMTYYLFLPAEATIESGKTFTWINDDEVEHQIRVADLGLTSERMEYGTSYSVKFDKPGEYEIRCTIHAGMRMKVKVTQ